MRSVVALAVLLAACGDDGGTPRDGDVADAIVSDGTVGDPCEPQVGCPLTPSVVRGSGLFALDRCSFPLAPSAPANADALIDAYPLMRLSIADVALDLNRVAARSATVPGGPTGLIRAYAWQPGDEAVTYWTPQGITGSFDATATGTIGGKKLVLVSWYYTKENETGSTVEKGIRIAIADVTNPDAVTYRFALLVEPTGTVAAPSFVAVPYHAGGLAWIGDRLYVPITGSGFRVFDLSRILKVTALDDLIGRTAAGTYNAHGYAYAIPQIATYTSTQCDPRFSFVALDRTSTPPSLISGEYDAATVNGRLYRWPLAADGTLQLTSKGRVLPDDAWVMAESHIQGAAAKGATVWLSSSRPAGSGGELVRTSVGATSTYLPWSDSPEDLAIDPQGASVWSLTEGLDARYFFEIALAAID